MNEIERGSIVELQLDEGKISFGVSSGAGIIQRFEAGSVAGARAVLEQGHLTASKIEVAIAEVEDLIMPTLRSFARGSDLRVSGPELVGVLRNLASKGETVSISTVEALFNQVAGVASGSPPSLHEVPTEPRLVLGLVVLREVMHHGGFSSVSVLPGKP
jgi:hypothetical protein